MHRERGAEGAEPLLPGVRLVVCLRGCIVLVTFCARGEILKSKLWCYQGTRIGGVASLSGRSAAFTLTSCHANIRGALQEAIPICHIPQDTTER